MNSSSLPPGRAPAAALAIVNARVWTGDLRRPWADAVLVRGELIDAVGSGAELRKRAGTGVPVVDARGMLVLPGSIGARTEEAFAELARRTDPIGEGAGVRPGAPADLVLLDRDLSRRESSANRGEAQVVLELVGGRIVYDARLPVPS